MRTENVSLPYPVLGISDDIRPTLEETGCEQPEITVDEEGDLFRISVILKLMDEDIINYIQDGLAEYSVEVSCHSTMYRNCISSSSPVFSFTVEKKLLNGKLYFESFVIARKDIIDYKNKGLNPDYEGHTINLHKGDLLVAYEKSSIPLNLDLRNIRNMKSFITVQKNTNPYEHSVKYELDSPKILILLPEEMMVEYNKKPSNSKEQEERKVILKASLYLQALTFALLNYQEFKDGDHMWVNALSYRMNELDIKDFCSSIFSNDSKSPESQNMGDLFKLAHMMLNQPYLGMLKHISTADNIVGPIINEE